MREQLHRLMTQAGITPDRANDAIDGYAHALAEKIRAEFPDPNPLASIFTPYAGDRAADLIDPYTRCDQS